MGHKFDFTLENIKLKQGKGTSIDAMTLIFKRPRKIKDRPFEESEDIDLINYFGNLWNKEVELDVNIAIPTVAAVNESVNFCGKVVDISYKAYKDGDAQLFNVLCEFDISKYADVAHYVFKNVIVEISEIQPDLIDDYGDDLDNIDE